MASGAGIRVLELSPQRCGCWAGSSLSHLHVGGAKASYRSPRLHCVASAPPIRDELRQAVSHRGSNGELTQTHSIEMTYADERAQSRRPRIASCFKVKGWAQSERRGIDADSVAARFEVSRAWVHRLVQRRRETGSIARRKQTKFRGRVLSERPEERLVATCGFCHPTVRNSIRSNSRLGS